MRKRLAGAIGLALVAMASGCSDTTSARETFGDESLATEQFPGLVVVSEDWADGTDEDPVTGKTTHAQLTRRFTAAEGASLADGFAELLEEAEASGWERDADVSNDERLVATKELEAGTAQLRIRLFSKGDYSGDGEAYILLDLSL